MAIPDYQACMLPLLRFAGDKKEHSLRETIDHLASHFKLAEGELSYYPAASNLFLTIESLGLEPT